VPLARVLVRSVISDARSRRRQRSIASPLHPARQPHNGICAYESGAKGGNDPDSQATEGTWRVHLSLSSGRDGKRSERDTCAALQLPRPTSLHSGARSPPASPYQIPSSYALLLPRIVYLESGRGSMDVRTYEEEVQPLRESCVP
jgi:hypothetical protein